MSETKFYGDFRKGVNDTIAPSHLADSELVLGENIDLSERGGFSTRKGQTVLGSKSDAKFVQAKAWNVGIQSRKVLVREDIAPLATEYHVSWVDEVGANTEIQQVASLDVGLFIVSNVLYITDGTKYYRRGGTDYVATMATTTVSANEIVYNNMPGGDKKFYRAKSALGSIDLSTVDYTNVTDWEDYTDIAGVISLESKEVVANAETDNDLAPIKKCTMFVQHPDSLRIFASGNPDDPTALYFSEVNDPSYFKLTSILRPLQNDGPVTGICALEDSLMVSYGNLWYHWTGLNPSDATWKPLPLPWGCASYNSLVVTPLSITFLGKTNIYKVSIAMLNKDVVSVQTESTIQAITDSKVENIVASIVKPEISVGIYVDDKYLLAYCDDEALDYNNKILVYDWSSKAFHVITGWRTYDFVKDSRGDLFIASYRYVLMCYQGYHDIDTDSDNGASKSIPLKVTTKQFNLSYLLNPKYVKTLYLVFKQYKEIESLVNVSIKADYNDREILDIDLTESLIWGRDWLKKWGWRDVMTFGQELALIAESFQITIESDHIDNPITCYGVGFEYDVLEPNPTMIGDGKEDLLK